MAINSTSKDYIKYIIENDDLYFWLYDFLNPDNRTSTAGTKEQIREFFLYGTIDGENVNGFDIPAGGNIITLQESDPYSVAVFNYCISMAVVGAEVSNVAIVPKEYEAVAQATAVLFDGFQLSAFPTWIPQTAQEQLAAEKNAKLLREHFDYNNIMFYEDRSFFTYQKYAFKRLNSWYEFSGGDQNLSNEEYSEIEKYESTYSSELEVINSGEDATSAFNNEAFTSFIAKAYNNVNQTDEKYIFDPLLRAAYGNRDIKNSSNFFNIFRGTSNSVKDLSEMNASILFGKMEEIGLLNLSSYAYEISEFAKKRLRSKDTLKASADNVINPEVDLPWLISLTETVQKLKKDPLSFASIAYYFPSLTTFLVDALAVVGDYSNNGKGGGEEDTLNNPEDFARSLEKAFGVTREGKAIFEMAYKFTNTSQRIQNVLKTSPFRANIAPNVPDIFHLRLGASNFYVPPISIDVNSSFKTGSLTGAAIRQKNSPKFNSGYKETSVRMRLFFPNYEEIWGLSIDNASQIDLNDTFKIDFKNGGDSEIKIDKFLSSLRGLVAAFKYSPFLPIKNHYLNVVHGITAVALSSMTVSTIPNYPFALAVDLELLNFNHQPFLPMIKDFNQAIHWGKYRQYMGKAAGHLHDYVNEEFLLKKSDVKEADNTVKTGIDFGFGIGVVDPNAQPEPTPTIPQSGAFDSAININVISEWRNGNNISLFAPAETQTKIFLPDTSSFRTKQEKMYTDLGQGTWESLLSSIGIDINQSTSYGVSLQEVQDISLSSSFSKATKDVVKDAINILTAGINSDNMAEQAYAYFVASFIAENKNVTSAQQEWLKNSYNSYSLLYPEEATYIFQGKYLEKTSLNAVRTSLERISENPSSYLDYLREGMTKEKLDKIGIPADEITDDTRAAVDAKVRKELAQAFSATLYERFFKSGPIQSLMEAARERAGAFQFKEWEVPMIQVDLDPQSVIVNGVTVSMGNSLAKLQIQMQDEPTYQHIGGRDSNINISMTVIGEKELIKLKNVFDHISGLARLEHATGVIGFLGIKNIITALCGIKYVLPLNYSVSTIPNYPHAYDVQLSLIDFDIFQQKREELSSTQQKELIDQFSTKKNPFLRIKQFWGTFNSYPDFPLSVKNSGGDVVGHLDPDFYFRSFEMFDKDVVNSFSTQHQKIQDYNFDTHSNGAGGVGGEGYDVLGITAKILEFITSYNNSADETTTEEIVNQIKDYIVANQIGLSRFIHIFRNVVTGDTEFSNSANVQLLTDFITFAEETSEINPYFEDAIAAPFQQGDLSPNSASNATSIEAAITGAFSLPNEEYVSFDPDEVDFHKQVFTIPASDPKDVMDGRIPSILQTAAGTHFGYIDRANGRFYLTAGGDNVKKVNNENDGTN